MGRLGGKTSRPLSCDATELEKTPSVSWFKTPHLVPQSR